MLNRIMSYTVLITARTLGAEGRQLLVREGCRVLFLEAAGDAAEVEAILAREKDDAVMSRTVDLTGSALADCPSPEEVSNHGVGVSHIDRAAAHTYGLQPR